MSKIYDVVSTTVVYGDDEMYVPEGAEIVDNRYDSGKLRLTMLVPKGADYICAESTADGSPCERSVEGYHETCHEHGGEEDE